MNDRIVDSEHSLSANVEAVANSTTREREREEGRKEGKSGTVVGWGRKEEKREREV